MCNFISHCVSWLREAGFLGEKTQERIKWNQTGFTVASSNWKKAKHKVLTDI